MNIESQKLELVELILGINNANILEKLKAAVVEATGSAVSETFGEKKYNDDTEYLLSTDANRESLRRSLEQSEREEGKSLKIKYLWK